MFSIQYFVVRSHRSTAFKSFTCEFFTMFNINALHARSVFAASRTNAAASCAIPTQPVENDPHGLVFQLNLTRTPKSQFQVGMLCITPYELPPGGPLAFPAFAAAPSHLIWRVVSITPQSLSIRFLAATHQPDSAAVVAVLGVDNPTVTVNKPSHILIPGGDLLHVLQPAIAAAEGALVPPHPAQAAGVGPPVGAVDGAVAPSANHLAPARRFLVPSAPGPAGSSSRQWLPHLHLVASNEEIPMLTNVW